MVGRENQQAASQQQARCSQHRAEMTAAVQWEEQTAAAVQTACNVQQRQPGRQLGLLEESCAWVSFLPGRAGPRRASSLSLAGFYAIGNELSRVASWRSLTFTQSVTP